MLSGKPRTRKQDALVDPTGPTTKGCAAFLFLVIFLVFPAFLVFWVSERINNLEKQEIGIELSIRKYGKLQPSSDGGCPAAGQDLTRRISKNGLQRTSYDTEDSSR